ncbi:MAG: beta-galactosidase, partial [Candidatus Aenigmarchaeota archaeon]|nr:beta-galactosidase [Candidatus Aenigmarchaeota archaeon]
TMFNHYMGCGGTSWNQLPSSETYTSYDFAAPVSEVGLLGENYFKSKEINYFLNGFNLSSTDLTAEGKDIINADERNECLQTPAFAEENVFARLRKDNLNECKWLFLRNLNKKSKIFNILNQHEVTVKPFDMKILPVDLDLKGCKIDFCGMSIFGRIAKDDKEIVLILLEKDNELKISGFEQIKYSLPVEATVNEVNEIKKTIIKSENLKEFSSCKLFRNNKMTKFVFLTESTADKTWIFEDKIIIGAEFLTDNLEKAAFSKNSEVKILNFEDETDFKTTQISVNTDIEKPELSEWLYFKGSPEIDMMYDYSGWDFLENEKFDCISNEMYGDYIWYKGSFKGSLDNIEINAKHCYAIYLNGKQLFCHNSLKYKEGTELSEVITVNIDKNDKKILNDKGLINELTILTQNLGFDRGFQNE